MELQREIATHRGQLSTRQVLVLQLGARGYSPRQIAYLLGCSVPAVTELLDAAAEQLECKTDWHRAFSVARQRGLIV